jgi:DNA repair exonuclease SbcCD ATPase subunit
MTDNDIVKTLEICQKAKHPGDCEYMGCPARTKQGCRFYSRTDEDEDHDMVIPDEMFNAALDLINRQKAEIERLTSTQEILKKRLDNCLHFAEENVELTKENRGLLLRLKQCETESESLKIAIEVAMDNLGDARAELQKAESEIESLEAEIDKQYEQAKADILGNMSNGGTSCHWCIDKHRAEAIKEFAERLKAEATLEHGGVTVVYGSCIDNLVKEMTEETP